MLTFARDSSFCMRMGMYFGGCSRFVSEFVTKEIRLMVRNFFNKYARFYINYFRAKLAE